MILSAKKEYVFSPGEVTKSCHASTVLPLDDGSVLAAWFGGKHEKDDSVEIWLSKRSPSGQWSKPFSVTEGDDVAHWNPVLFERTDGTVVLFYKYGREISDWETRFTESYDNGETWTSPAPLVPGDTSGGRGPVKNKCLRLADGAVVAPASSEQGKWRVFFDLSHDDGRSFERTPFLPVPRYKGRDVGLIQPTLWQDGDGTVNAFMRSDKGAVYHTFSKDGAKTWSKPRRTRLPNNNSGIDLTKDGKGRIWLLYNPVAENWGVRHPLSLAVSTDNGRHFTEILVPEPGAGEFSYPAITAKGGKLFITYTHKRKQIVFWEIETE